MVPTKLKSGGDASPPSPTDLRPCKYAEIMSEMNIGYLLAQSTFTWLLFLVSVVEKDFSRSNTH